MRSTPSIKKEANKRVKYSNQEAKLLELLAKGDIISSEQLAERLYDGEQAPYHARSSVTAVLRVLIDKLDHNGEPFTISKTRQSGPYPTQYRKVQRSRPKRV